MDNFSIIYKILKSIELSMDYDEFDENLISAEFLNITQQRRDAIICELVEQGYVSGIKLIPILGKRTPGIRLCAPKITIKGMEYLSENSMMKKAYRLAKGIKDVVPGI